MSNPSLSLYLCDVVSEESSHGSASILSNMSSTALEVDHLRLEYNKLLLSVLFLDSLVNLVAENIVALMLLDVVHACLEQGEELQLVDQYIVKWGINDVD